LWRNHHKARARAQISGCRSPKSIETGRLHVGASGLLHAELVDKLLANKCETIRLRMARMQVEAVVKMLQPGCNVASIAAKRCNKMFKRDTVPERGGRDATGAR
jgi:hypothetical protein